MKWIYLAVLIFSIHYFFRLFSGKPKRNLTKFIPQTPVVRVDGNTIWLMGESQLKTGEETQYSMLPPERVKDAEPVPVSQAAELTVHFQKKPVLLQLNRWQDMKVAERKIMKGDSIYLPKQPGVYVYDLYAKWDEGYASYAFVVEVQ
jgi:hypothetical protein